MDLDFTTKEWLALAGAVLGVVGAFLPWQQTPGGAVAGIEGVGVVTLVVAALAGGAVLLAEWSEQGVVASALGGAIAALVAVYKLTTLGGVVSPGLGLYLTLLGGLGLFAAGAWGMLAGERPDALEA